MYMYVHVPSHMSPGLPRRSLWTDEPLRLASPRFFPLFKAQPIARCADNIPHDVSVIGWQL